VVARDNPLCRIWWSAGFAQHENRAAESPASQSSSEDVGIVVCRVDEPIDLGERYLEVVAQ